MSSVLISHYFEIFVDENYFLNVTKNHRPMPLNLFINLVIKFKINKSHDFCHHYKYNSQHR
jgi:hypothetical protein